MGDFNLDLLKIESSCCNRDLFLSLQSCYLIPSIDKPTRVYNNSATLIDNIFINMPERVTISGNIISDITDHFSQFCIFKSTKDEIEIPLKQQRRDFSQFSAVNFNNELSLTDWDEIFLKGDRDIDKTFCSIYKRINAILNKHAPIKLISRRQARRLSKPWITKGIRAAIKHKNQLYADGKQSEYKIYRNRIQRSIRLSKANYYCEYFNKHLTNMKKTWEGINTIMIRKTQKSSCIQAIKDHNNGNRLIRNATHIPDILNNHFASVGHKLANQLLDTRKHYSDFLIKSKSPRDSFCFNLITPDEVKLEILALPINKAHGLYSCPSQILKCASDIISFVLCRLFNLSIVLGVYPSKLKMSKIIPIFKNDDRTDANNYRPISLLSNFNRLFEKMMYKRMQNFIQKHAILSSCQYGFPELHSTEHAILDIVNTIQSNMAKKLFSCGVFIDLKKAFDTVDHEIILQKLCYYGFRGIINDWFSSYLNGRTQTTQIGNHISKKATITCGVPQGFGSITFLALY